MKTDPSQNAIKSVVAVNFQFCFHLEQASMCKNITLLPYLRSYLRNTRRGEETESLMACLGLSRGGFHLEYAFNKVN